MTKSERACLIISHVMNLDAAYGTPCTPRAAANPVPTRRITDDPRWHARISKQYEKGEDGELWDLFELEVYGSQRMTAAIKGSEINLRYYLPGPWEPIFVIVDTKDTVPLRP